MEESNYGKEDRLYHGWIVVIVCLTVMTLLAPLLASFSIFYVAIMKDLNWNREETAIAVAIFLVVNGLAGPAAGALIDRYKARWLMPIGTIVTAVALFWMSRMASTWEFYLAYGVLASVGSSLIHLVTFSTIVSNWFVRHRGLAIGAVTAGQGLGQAAIPAIQYLIDTTGWRGAYLVVGLVIFVIPTVLILLFLHGRPEEAGVSLSEERLPWEKRRVQGQAEAPAQQARSFGFVIVDHNWAATDWTVFRAMRTLRFWQLTLLITLFGAGYMMVNVQLVAYLEDKGYSSMLAASAVAWQGVIYIFGRFLGGALSDRYGREMAVTISAGIFLLFLVFLYAAGMTASPMLVYASATLYGIGGAMPLPALMAATGDIFQGKHLGAIIGVLMIGGFVGGGLGAWLGGRLFDAMQSYNPHFVLTVLATIASAALIWWAKPSSVRAVRATAV
ncbi:MAG: MFS transporter [Acidobacteria bacterium]|nr:MFS transporter [Acidobacteriota bacterium]MCW5970053.1 MFS transporter [Blastocatellales bacterium]